MRYPTDHERVQKAEATALQEYQARQQSKAIAAQECLEKQQEKQQREKLAAYLRSLGINPDEI